MGGRLIGRCRGRGKESLAKGALCFCLCGDLGMLAYWKYGNFVVRTVTDLTGLSWAVPNILLPIGISFFTFQGISYVTDVYRGTAPAQKSLLKTGLYIALFPQLIAGPIVRYAEIEKQLTGRKHSVENFAAGIRLFAVGLAKKVILANGMGATADAVFQIPGWQNGMAVAWTGLFSYVFQLYFDFSGYSDMAVGIGRMFGFSFPQNFNYPYISRSIAEFWRRWHMSLSGWFRDYVYIPLGGNRTGHTGRNLFLVFVLTGIWHGASWNFVVWGLYWGILIVAERYLAGKIKYRPPAVLSWAVTMLLWTLSMVFFRSGDLRESIWYFRGLFHVQMPPESGFTLRYYVGRYELFLFLVCAVAATPVGTNVCRRLCAKLPGAAKTLAEDGAALVLLAVSAVYVVTETYNPFIYFQF